MPKPLAPVQQKYRNNRTLPGDLGLWFSLASILAATALARLFEMNARCNNDEHRYVAIVERIQLGQAWPVSGPGFSTLMQAMADWFHFPLSKASAVLGVGSACFLVVSLGVFYFKLAQTRAVHSLWALACTSYFWATLSESRPQLIGCSLLIWALLFIRHIGTQLQLNQAVWWIVIGLLLGFTTAQAHILTFFILCLLCLGATLAYLTFKTHNFGSRAACLLAPVISGCTFILWPGGQYAHLLRDIQQTHLQHPVPLFWSIFALAVGLGGGWWKLKVRLSHSSQSVQNDWLYWVSHFLSRIPLKAIAITGAMVVTLAFMAQTALLPDNYFRFYQHSIAGFATVQIGNLLFASFFLIGLVDLIEQIKNKTISEELWFVASCTAALGAIALSMLFASLALADINWMLRVMDYALLVGAVIGGIGLHACWQNWQKLTTLALIIAIVTSYTAGNKSILIYAVC